MSGMRFTPKGYGGHRRNPDEVKRDGWKEQGLLAVAIDDGPSDLARAGAGAPARRAALRQAGTGGAPWVSGPQRKCRIGWSSRPA